MVELPEWITDEAEKSWRSAIDGMNERAAAEGRPPTIDEDTRAVKAQKMAHLHGFLAGFRFGAKHGG